MVLCASHQLEGAALAWWESYLAMQPAGHIVTWGEFRAAFRQAHVPVGVMDVKRQEFLALRQGRSSVVEYVYEFNHLARYAPEDVATAAAKQYKFRSGLSEELKEKLALIAAPDFQTLVDQAIVAEHAGRELFASPSASGRYRGPLSLASPALARDRLRGRRFSRQHPRGRQLLCLALHRPCLNHVHLWLLLLVLATWPTSPASSAARRATMRTPAPRRLEEPLVLMEDAGKVVVTHLTKRWLSDTAGGEWPSHSRLSRGGTGLTRPQ